MYSWLNSHETWQCKKKHALSGCNFQNSSQNLRNALLKSKKFKIFPGDHAHPSARVLAPLVHSSEFMLLCSLPHTKSRSWLCHWMSFHLIIQQKFASYNETNGSSIFVSSFQVVLQIPCMRSSFALAPFPAISGTIFFWGKHEFFVCKLCHRRHVGWISQKIFLVYTFVSSNMAETSLIVF